MIEERVFRKTLIGFTARALLGLAFLVAAEGQRVLASDKSTLRGTVTAGNGIYNVHVEDIAGSGIGLYTVTTGAAHPAGSGLNVLFGDGSPGTTFNTIRSYTSGTDYVQDTATKTSVNAVISLEPFGTVTPIGTTGFRTTYVLPGPPTTPDALTIISDVKVNGTTFDNSTVEVTTTVINDGSTSVDIGIRYLWDFQVGGDDGPTFQEIAPDGAVRVNEAEFLAPGFKAYRIEDNDTNPSPPTFNVFGTVTGPATVVPTPTAPGLLQYACWPDAFDTAFEYTVNPTRDIATTASDCRGFAGGDVAVHYFFGHDSANAIAMPAGGQHKVSASLFLTEPRVEICGNCIDDDGDGLVDLLDPDCASSALALKKGTLNLKPDPNQDKINLQGSFTAPPDSIDPPAEGVILSLIDGDGVIACFNIPPGEGWKTSPGPKWSFKDKKDDSLGDPEADEKLSIKFNAKTGKFEWKMKVKEAELVDPDAGDISTSVLIGGDGFLNTQEWKAKGKKLSTP